MGHKGAQKSTFSYFSGLGVPDSKKSRKVYFCCSGGLGSKIEPKNVNNMRFRLDETQILAILLDSTLKDCSMARGDSRHFVLEGVGVCPVQEEGTP